MNDNDSRYADGETLLYIKNLEAERDEYRAALEKLMLCDIAEVRTIPGSCGALRTAREALAKYPREDEVEQARRLT